MNKLTHILLLSFLVPSLSFGQLAGMPPNGPISLALGGISSPLSNSYSIFNNPAGLANHENFDAVFAYQTIFNYGAFNTASAAINYHGDFGTAAVGFFRFGDNLFSSIMASAAYGGKLGIVSLGGKINYLQYNVDGFGNRGIVVAEMGAIADLAEDFSFGMHIYNFTQSVISEESREKIPVVIRLSARYQLADEVNIYAEGEKDIEEQSDFKFGLAYKLIEALELRAGFSSRTNRLTFGAGLNISRITVDYALRANDTIRATHNFGLTYRFSD